MQYSILDLGTLKVNAFDMIRGMPEETIRKEYSVDEKGYMRIGMNGLVLELGNRIILFDPGCATFLPRRLAEEYDLKMERSMEEELENAGYNTERITDVIFTHLHFDHGSGSLIRVIGGIKALFPNAKYIVSKRQLSYIEKGSKEEKNSFFNKLLRYVEDVHYIEDQEFEGIDFYISDGHTNGMILPILDAGDHDILYATDLVPMKIHLHREAWSKYDVDPDLLQSEKAEVLQNLRKDSRIIYYHEPSLSQEVL